MDVCPWTRLEIEQTNSKSDEPQYSAKIVTKRNVSRLNNNQKAPVQSRRANCDIQVVIDHYACVEYLTKYAAKGEPRTPLLKAAFNTIMNNTPSNTDPHRATFKTLSEPDYAAQETMHHLLSPRLHSSSFTVMPVSLNGFHRVQINLSANEGLELC